MSEGAASTRERETEGGRAGGRAGGSLPLSWVVASFYTRMLWLKGPVFFSSRHCFVEPLAAADPEANVLSCSRRRGSIAENLIPHKTNRTTTNWSPKLVLNPCYTFFRSRRQEREREKHRQTQSEISTSYGMQQTEGDRRAKLMNRVIVRSCF
jgi:hypothetical protein